MENIRTTNTRKALFSEELYPNFLRDWKSRNPDWEEIKNGILVSSKEMVIYYQKESFYEVYDREN